MPPKKSTSPVKGRLISKNLTQRLEEALGQAAEEQPPVQDIVKEEAKFWKENQTTHYVREEPKGMTKSVIIVEKPREAMVGQGIPVRFFDDTEFTIPLLRIGVERMGGSLFHCILRAIYPPYMEWNREKRLRKVKEFRQDLAGNFDGYYLRLDQKNINWPSLGSCKKDLETCDGAIQYEFLDYIGKVINKNIVLITVTKDAVLQPIYGTKVYGTKTENSSSQATNSPNNLNQVTKTSSPITYSRAEPVFVYVLHLGGPAFELLSYRKNGTNFTLFPESHQLTSRILSELITS